MRNESVLLIFLLSDFAWVSVFGCEGVWVYESWYGKVREKTRLGSIVGTAGRLFSTFTHLVAVHQFHSIFRRFLMVWKKWTAPAASTSHRLMGIRTILLNSGSFQSKSRKSCQNTNKIIGVHTGYFYLVQVNRANRPLLRDADKFAHVIQMSNYCPFPVFQI